MSQSLNIGRAYCWLCPNCRRKNFAELPELLIRWENPDDVKLLQTRFTEQEIQDLRADYPNDFEMEVDPLVLDCVCSYRFPFPIHNDGELPPFLPPIETLKEYNFTVTPLESH